MSTPALGADISSHAGAWSAASRLSRADARLSDFEDSSQKQQTVPDAQQGAPVPVGKYPQDIAVSPDGKKAYVANYNNDSVSVIDTVTGKVVGTVTNYKGSHPYGVAFSPTQPKAYVTNYNSASVSVINTETDTWVGTVTKFAGKGPMGVAFSATQPKAYVVNTYSHSVSVINTATDTQEQTVTNYTSPGQELAFSPTAPKAYVANTNGHSVSVINTDTDSQEKTIANFSGSGPWYVAFSPNGKKAYVTNNYSYTVSVIDTETDTQTGTISDRAPGGTPLGVAFSRDGIKAYVVNYGSVLVVNAETDAPAGSVANFTGSNSWDVAFSPTEPTAYVTNGNSNTVSVIAFPAPVSPSILPDAVAGTDYAKTVPDASVRTLSVTGGYSAKYTFAMVTGNATDPTSCTGTCNGLPNGLSLSTDGVVSGTPTVTIAGGKYTFTPSVTNAVDHSYDGTSVSITVDWSAPVLTRVSPSTGSVLGGTLITITGRGFTAATEADFDQIPGTKLSVISDTAVTVVTPAHRVGPANVTIRTPRGDGSLSEGYTYVTSKGNGQ